MIAAQEKSLCNFKTNNNCRGITEKIYTNNIINMQIKVEIFGNPRKEEILNWIAIYARKFYLEVFDNKGF